MIKKVSAVSLALMMIIGIVSTASGQQVKTTDKSTSISSIDKTMVLSGTEDDVDPDDPEHEENERD